MHHNSPIADHIYSSYSSQNDGWDVTGGGGWGNAEVEGKQSESTEQQAYTRWEGEQTNGYDDSGHEEARANGTYDVADTQGTLPILCIDVS